jgi:hypothetical protein
LYGIAPFIKYGSICSLYTLSVKTTVTIDCSNHIYISLTGLISTVVIRTDKDRFPVPNEPFPSIRGIAGGVRGNGEEDESNQVRKIGFIIFEQTLFAIGGNRTGKGSELTQKRYQIRRGQLFLQYYYQSAVRRDRVRYMPEAWLERSNQKSISASY